MLTDRPYDNEHGRNGEWMQTSLGGQFFPHDPWSQEIRASDIANGLAKSEHYGSQAPIDKWYSVAEHSVHMARYVRRTRGEPHIALIALLHDASEGYTGDMPRCAKGPLSDFKAMEDKIQKAIWVRYGLLDDARDPEIHAYIKDLDWRMIANEKPALFGTNCRAWASDILEPLDGVRIGCWERRQAKCEWLGCFQDLCATLNLPTERLVV